MIRAFRQFLQDCRGSATVEMALMFPLILWPFLTGMEAGSMQLRRVMLERAIDEVGRDLRLGYAGLDTPDKLKAAVCREALVLPGCADNMMLEMTVVDPATFTPPATRPTCIDRSEKVQPVLSYRRGGKNDMMMLRFCILYDPILPGTGIGAGMIRPGKGGVPIFATTFYVNEP